MDMKPKQRAKAIAEQLEKSDRRKWPALIEAAIRDAENAKAIGRRRMTPNRITQQHGFLNTLLKTMCTDLDLRELVT